MKRQLLAFALLLLVSSCKDSPSEPAHSVGCGDGSNPDSLFVFKVIGNNFPAVELDPPESGSRSLYSRRGKDGQLRYTISRSISIASKDTSASFSLVIPKWESGEYSWGHLDKTISVEGAYLAYYWQDRTTNTWATHEYYSVSGGATLKVDGPLTFQETTVLLGTFCGNLRDSLGNEIRIEDGLIHFRFDR
jgi:hypothetical protein